MRYKYFLLTILLFSSFVLYSQSVLPADDSAIQAVVDSSGRHLIVKGISGEYSTNEINLKDGSDYYYSVESIGSAGHLVFVWEFTRVVSMGSFETRYWLAQATSFHLVDIAGGYLGRASADNMFRFAGDVSKEGTKLKVQIFRINGLYPNVDTKSLTAYLRRLDRRKP